MKRLWLLAMFLALALAARAQQIPATANLTAQDSGSCTTPNACLVLNVGANISSSVIQLSGTWSATAQFEATTTAGGSFAPIAGYPIGGTTAVTSATTTGAWRFNVASVTQIRVRISAYTSGTVVAAITGSPAWSEIAPGLQGGTGGGGGGGVSSLTGDATVECGIGLTGTVTLPLCEAPPNTVLAGPSTVGPGAPSYTGMPDINIGGNAATASAFVDTPTTCTPPQVSTGISPNGNAICMTFSGGALKITGNTTLTSSNSGQFIVAQCASPCTVTLPAAVPSSVWNTAIQWAAGYSQVTVNPNGLTLNGSSGNYAIPIPGVGIFLTTDGSNYYGAQPNEFIGQVPNFTGADAGVRINACLTFAHTVVSSANTSSGVCDARGLTGILTATHHISIPASTTLLWGQAQLTITDTTTNDAVELAGDGAGIWGMNASGLGTVPRPQTGGYIACGGTGCTAVDNPNSATANIDWVTIQNMYLQAYGTGSIVLNLSSIGHADIENNRFVLGTGGSSYGVYGNTSAGDLDSTNSLVKHNEFDLESQNDIGIYVAGIFNSIKFEQNSVYLPAENTGTQGFVIDKDTNGNYPDNDEFDANDCEAASQSFGQICFNLVGAQNVQIGPTNRCENVYNCFQQSANGSAVGNHIIDPYLSVSVNTVLKPNEPTAAQQAFDNNSANWQPSFHYGMSDLAGKNLFVNANFEGWNGTTTLDWWGGVSGTNINQAGSGIYQQQLSSSSPTDTTTQGTYNVLIGDNATAGLGINSGCIRVDALMNYTLAFRVVSSSTSVKFRPGFRFYYDPNCTEADRITSVSTNARILQPGNYGGTANAAINGTGGTPGNWESTNASLTYNNGITCNCNVTGADWTVAATNAWTPTPNYAITFRVPDAYSSASTIAQSMRVFILENTAANPNQIYVDDVALSQGPISPNVPPGLLPDTNPSVYNPTLYGTIATGSNCANGSSPAACGSATAGAVAVPTGTNPTLVIDTTAVTASSRILLTIDESASIGGTTCNTTLATLVEPVITSRIAGTSFTIQIGATLATNPACVSFLIMN